MKKVTPDAARLTSDRIDGFPQLVLGASQFSAPGTDARRIDEANAVTRGGRRGGAWLGHDGYSFQRHFIVAGPALGQRHHLEAASVGNHAELPVFIPKV
jgi:hypothetical protein